MTKSWIIRYFFNKKFAENFFQKFTFKKFWKKMVQSLEYLKRIIFDKIEKKKSLFPTKMIQRLEVLYW